jgi:hypothetical protein
MGLILDDTGAFSKLAIFLISLAALAVIQYGLDRRRALRFRGPPASSWLFGVQGDVFKAIDATSLYSAWSNLYGSIFCIPQAFGAKTLVIMDPKAVASIYAKDTNVYRQSNALRIFFKNNVSFTLEIIQLPSTWYKLG